MKKDAYYFPHFSNARNDPKVLKLRRVLGLEGYAIYFMLLEILREQTDWRYPIDGIPELEFELRASKEKITNVITAYDLFEVDEAGKFFSPKLILYLQPYIEKSEKARESALKRWGNANALQPHSDGNASKVKESKGEESKVNESKLPFDSLEFKKAWEDWEEHRRQVKRKLTPKTKEMQLRTLGAVPEQTAIDMINQSIGNGWQGLFELKTKQNGNGTSKNFDSNKLTELIKSRNYNQGAGK